jgi:hypothetical protein
MAESSDSNKFYMAIAFAFIVGIAVYYLTSNMFYSKSEVYTKAELDEILKNKLTSEYYSKNQVETLVNNKPSCKYIDFMLANDAYFGQTPRSICQKIKLEPELLFIRSIATASNDGVVTYVSEATYFVSVEHFDEPLGKATDIPREYGRPDSVYAGLVNQYTAGLLCC